MNQKQKKLSYVFVVIFALTVLFAPFDIKNGEQSVRTVYRPIFAPPGLVYNGENPGKSVLAREVAPSLGYTWVGLGLMFYGLLGAFRVGGGKPQQGGRGPGGVGGGGGGRPRQQNFRSSRPPNKP